MGAAIKLVPVMLYILIGVISLIMAIKCLFSKEFLPFHEKACGKPWNEIEDRLKPVILSFMRLSGLGFLIVSMMLLVFPVVNYFISNIFYKYSVPALALIFCTGLFMINYSLYKATKADTPWKGSLFAMFVVAAGIGISII